MIIPVVLAGGFGKRLWPLSTKDRPKQFLKIIDNHSGFQHSVLNAVRVNNKIVILCNSQFEQQARAQLAELEVTNATIIFEAENYNTGMAVTIASLAVAAINASAAMLILPSDHLIENFHVLADYLPSLNHINNKLILFGIKPLQFETNYGYIENSGVYHEEMGLFEVNKFIEKPDHKTIKRLQSNNTSWNSGIFFFPVKFFLSEIAIINPKLLGIAKHLYETSLKIGKDFYLAHREDTTVFPSIDYLLLENCPNLLVATLDLLWQDLGSWKSLLNFFYQLHIQKPSGLVVKKSWGKYEIIKNGNGFLVKIITIKPWQQTSLQYHQYRAEYYMICQGHAKVIINEKLLGLAKGESGYVPIAALHQISNHRPRVLKIIEIQIGDILLEEDIVRLNI